MSDRRRLVRLLAAVAVILVAACGTSEERDGRYSSLLRLVPDQPAFRDGVTIVDYEAIRALPGYEESRPLGQTDKEAAADPEALTKALGWHGVGIPFREILGTPWDSLPPNLANWELGFGFGLPDVDLALTAGVMPPRTLHAIGGDFDPAAIEDQLEACTDCAEGEEREYRGQRYFTWGEGQMLNQRLAPPATDDLGRGGNFVFASDYVVRSNFIEELEASIDAAQGRASLLDDDDFALLADELDALDLLALVVSNRTQGPELAEELIERSRGGDSDLGAQLAAAWKPPSDAVRLQPYEVFAIGIGVSDDELFTAIVLVHDSDDRASANVDLLAQRIETGLSVTGSNGWSELFTATEISSSGRVLTAILRGDARLGAFVNVEPLLLHE